MTESDDVSDAMNAFVERMFERMIHDVCVTRASSRVLDAVLELLFMRLCEPLDSTDHVVPPMFTGLPMVLRWDYFGGELFPDGRWSTEQWLALAGCAP